MKKYNTTEIEDIALRYAYDKKSLTEKNVKCFIAGFSMAQVKCKEKLLDVIKTLAKKEKKYKEELDYGLSLSGWWASRPEGYEKDVSDHHKVYVALQNLADVLGETGIDYDI